ncbi:MAG TPA: hypothetical protein PLD20_05560 [Blastocatellia bacterium]|nr:hypothetical protein [Blastocatellia bacterium]HMZ17373.1 hypothetical protein [Blastocatellia bacterium]
MNNRYYDYEANYDAVKQQPAKPHVHRLTESQCVGCKLETTIGHKREEKLVALKKARAV